MEFHNAPDWIPFACLITGKMPLRKPFLTRIAESILVGIIGGGFAFYMSVEFLKQDFVAEKKRMDEHLAKHEAQRILDIATRASDRLEQRSDVDRILNRFERLEDCIRLRTCTK